MHAASDNSSPDVLSVLVKAGAKINARDNDGMTPLMFAAGSNKNAAVICVALLRAGADRTLVSALGKPALDYTGENANLTKSASRDLVLYSLMLNGTADEVRAALRAGADVESKADDAMTPLMLAAEAGRNPEVISVLLEAGAKVENAGVTPLM